MGQGKGKEKNYIGICLIKIQGIIHRTFTIAFSLQVNVLLLEFDF